MNTDIGWPSSIRRARSAWSAALRRVFDGDAEQVDVDERHELAETLGGEPVDERLAHGGELLSLRCGARVVRSHLDGARDLPPSVDVRARRQVELGIGLVGAAGPVLGDLDAEVLVGGDIEPLRSSSFSRPYPGLPMSAASLQRTRYRPSVPVASPTASATAS